MVRFASIPQLPLRFLETLRNDEVVGRAAVGLGNQFEPLDPWEFDVLLFGSSGIFVALGGRF